MEIFWRSRQGTRTSDNRDQCGVGFGADAVLCVVLDGATTVENSGELVRVVARDLVDWFIDEPRVTTDAIVRRLRDIHGDVSPRFRRDSASFMIALVENGMRVQLLHAGNCMAGFLHPGWVVNWETRPHTFANVLDSPPVPNIARSPLRHWLTRSFRFKEFMTPDVSELDWVSEEPLVLATDGFWAALDPEAQVRFLTGAESSCPEIQGRDDCSVLILRHIGGRESRRSEEASDNLYMPG